MKGSLARLAFLALTLSATLGGAQQHRVELVYESADGCLDKQSLEAAVSARLGYSPFQPGAARRVEVRLKQEGGAMQGTLKLIEGDVRLGSRSFQSVSGEGAWAERGVQRRADQRAGGALDSSPRRFGKEAGGFGAGGRFRAALPKERAGPWRQGEPQKSVGFWFS